MRIKTLKSNPRVINVHFDGIIRGDYSLLGDKSMNFEEPKLKMIVSLTSV